jgi:hypothetical protein
VTTRCSSVARLCVGLSAVALAVAAPFAATKWEAKPYTAWTAEELKDLLNNSPWAGKGSITRIKSSGANSQPIEETALVTWTTALPMREALVREQIGLDGKVTPEVEAFLKAPSDAYMVAVKISGGFAAGTFAAQAAAAQKETKLVLSEQNSIAAVAAEGQLLDKDGKAVPMPARGGRPGGPGGAPPPGGPSGSAAPAPPDALRTSGVTASLFQEADAADRQAAATGLVNAGGGTTAFAQRGGGGFGVGGFGGGRGGGAQNSSLLIFVFAKGFGISKDHKEVEFVTRVGNYTIKRKFKVKDMLYKGELAL